MWVTKYKDIIKAINEGKNVYWSNTNYKIIKDNKNNYYINGYTYQLQTIQQTLLNNKELNIFKVNIYIDNQIIL